MNLAARTTDRENSDQSTLNRPSAVGHHNHADIQYYCSIKQEIHITELTIQRQYSQMFCEFSIKIVPKEATAG